MKIWICCSESNSSFYFYIVLLKKTEKMVRKQNFTGFVLEDWCSLWGLNVYLNCCFSELHVLKITKRVGLVQKTYHIIKKCSVLSMFWLKIYSLNNHSFTCFWYCHWHRGLALWCLTPLSTVFQLYRDDQFYWWRKSRVPEENHRPKITQ
jgi:hypothetical protein